MKFFNWFAKWMENDPVRSCEVYKIKGCSHVDGYLCNMKTCNILADYRNEQIICPVCGFYCAGKGGIGCIDKPSLCKQITFESTQED